MKNNTPDELDKETDIANEFEDLKKKFFVDVESFEAFNLRGYLERLMEFSKMTPNGDIIFERTDLNDNDTIALIVLTYYLGNKLNPDIPEELHYTKIVEITKIEKQTVKAQFSNLFKKRLVIKPFPGIYRFNPRKIDEFLKKLETNYKSSKKSLRE